ncbi:hypothetical protein [Pusillimonas minor]|uniref:Uncharacterized protein n=1 Tax=Pusillimonas minor TaxID=2697024 RepID=A0A842HSI9_9BURK|nr:hypothetical protein [Pusillimonas minor]MBC2771126.1 hypothetical protein [Pusillimonas minor]
MKASDAAGIGTFIVVLLGGFIGLTVDKYLGFTICVAALIWYARKGNYLRGYLTSESATSMRKEADEIEELSRTWIRADGIAVPSEERRRLIDRRFQLLKTLRSIEEESSRPW